MSLSAALYTLKQNCRMAEEQAEKAASKLLGLTINKNNMRATEREREGERKRDRDRER